jgi:hypothetical protein
MILRRIGQLQRDFDWGLHRMFQRACDWFGEARTAWYGAAVLIILMGCPHVLWGAAEAVWRWQGTAIEFLGLVCILLGFERVRRQFGLPSIVHAIADYSARALLIFRQRRVSTSVILKGVGSSTSIGAAVVHAQTSGSVDDRINQLEEQLRNFRNDFGRFRGEITEQVSHLEVSQHEERTARQAGDEAETRRLAETMTGDVQLELVGWTYICFGLFSANLAPDLAKWFS